MRRFDLFYDSDGNLRLGIPKNEEKSISLNEFKELFTNYKWGLENSYDLSWLSDGDLLYLKDAVVELEVAGSAGSEFGYELSYSVIKN